MINYICYKIVRNAVLKWATVWVSKTINLTKTFQWGTFPNFSQKCNIRFQIFRFHGEPALLVVN